MIIEVSKSPKGDSRSSDPSNTSIEELRSDTESHILDVSAGLKYLCEILKKKAYAHDHTKLENIAEFSDALKSGHIKETSWYQNHITEERHHLKMHVPSDVNLLDVLEHLVDCTMAGLTRSGEIYDTDISPDVLVLAVQNTVELLKQHTIVKDSEKDLLNETINL